MQEFKTRLKSEWSKIIWPGKKDLQKETTAVIISGILIGAFIAAVDFLTQNGVNLIAGLL